MRGSARHIRNDLLLKSPIRNARRSFNRSSGEKPHYLLRRGRGSSITNFSRFIQNETGGIGQKKRGRARNCAVAPLSHALVSRRRGVRAITYTANAFSISFIPSSLFLLARSRIRIGRMLLGNTIGIRPYRRLRNRKRHIANGMSCGAWTCGTTGNSPCQKSRQRDILLFQLRQPRPSHAR